MLTEQDKKTLKAEIQFNQHQIFIVSINEMDAIVRSTRSYKKPRIEESWLKIKGKVEGSANYTASASDVVTLSKLVGDLGGVGAKVYIKNYGGKPHIIIKGRAGLRKVLTGTKYGINNPKVITMGLGKVGAINAAKMGGIISVVLLTTYRVADYFLTDQSTLTKLVGYLAVDIVKVGITTGASIAVVSALTGGIALAIGPIVAVVIVGFFVTAALNSIDERYGLSKRVVAGLDELASQTIITAQKTKQSLENTVNHAVDSVLDFAIESAKRILINLAQHSIHKFLSSAPRFY